MITIINRYMREEEKGRNMFNCRNYTLGVFVPKAKQRDTKHTIGIISI